MKALIAIVLLLVAPPVFSMSRSYNVTIENETECTLQLKLQQFHSINFNGTRPRQFTEDLLSRTELIAVAPGRERTVRFSDSAGGFWVTWQTVDQDSCASSSGVVDLTKRENSIRIK
jgi:hypothetical protein